MESLQSEGSWDDEGLTVHALDGQPPLGFDCGDEAQNSFLYRRAWRDMKAGVSVTHLLFMKGILAGYITLLTDKVSLGPEDVLRSVYWKSVPAVKIGQIAVDRRFSGLGLGKFLIGYSTGQVHHLRRGVGCRVLSLDANPEVVGWYESQGFDRNVQEQRDRIERARAAGRQAEHLPVSMRFDLREARR